MEHKRFDRIKMAVLVDGGRITVEWTGERDKFVGPPDEVRLGWKLTPSETFGDDEYRVESGGRVVGVVVGTCWQDAFRESMQLMGVSARAGCLAESGS